MARVSHTRQCFTDYETVEGALQRRPHFSRTKEDDHLHARYDFVYVSYIMATTTPKKHLKSYLGSHFFAIVIHFC